MITILHSFGAGIAFVIGCFCGVFFAAVIVRNNTAKEREENKRHAISVEARLYAQAVSVERIAMALEARKGAK